MDLCSAFPAPAFSQKITYQRDVKPFRDGFGTGGTIGSGKNDRFFGRNTVDADIQETAQSRADDNYRKNGCRYFQALPPPEVIIPVRVHRTEFYPNAGIIGRAVVKGEFRNDLARIVIIRLDRKSVVPLGSAMIDKVQIDFQIEVGMKTVEEMIGID